MLPQNELSLPEGVYPLGSQQGVAIPLDVARPKKGYYSGIAASGSHSITLDNTKFNLVSLCSTVYATLSTIDDAVSGEEAPVASTFVLIPNMNYELIVSKNLTFTNLTGTAGTLVVNQITRWSQLQNIGAYGSTR